MNPLKAAIGFITILPVGKNVDFDPDRMIPFFPAVGLLIGILLALADAGFRLIWPDQIAALFDVLFLIVVTGAFHIDGLGDSADGLFSHRSRDRALEIMKDSRMGTMGIVAIIAVLALKWAGIGAMDTHRSLVLVIVPAYARAGIIFGIRYLKYGRPEGGTGSEFFNAPLPLRAFAGFLPLLLFSLFLGGRCLLFNAVFAAVVSGILFFYKRQLNCITGDMLGAMVEVTEAALFLVMAAGTGF